MVNDVEPCKGESALHAAVWFATASEVERPSLLKRKKSVAPVQPEIMTDDEVREIERENVRKALEKAGWKVYGDDGAAALLQIKPTTLVSRMQKMGLGKPA